MQGAFVLSYETEVELLAAQPVTPGTLAFAVDTGNLFVWDSSGSWNAVGGGGGGSGALLHVGGVDANSDGSSTELRVDGIAGASGDLVVVCQARTDRAAIGDNLVLQVGNGDPDPGPNYSWQRSRRSDTQNDTVGVDTARGVGADSTGAAGADATGASADADCYGYVKYEILDYAAMLGGHRTVRGSSGRLGAAGNRMLGEVVGMWADTATPIDVVRVFPLQGTAFAKGSRLDVYRRAS